MHAATLCAARCVAVQVAIAHKCLLRICSWPAGVRDECAKGGVQNGNGAAVGAGGGAAAQQRPPLWAARLQNATEGADNEDNESLQQDSVRALPHPC